MWPPEEPNKDDCCNSGCNPCIFDVYETQLQLYKKYLKNGETDTTTYENGISQLEYTTFIVVKTTDLCKSHKLIAFKKMTSNGLLVSWKPGDHFLLKYVSDEAACTRAYTPIKFKCIGQDIDFSIAVKKYDNGLVSNFLYYLEEGDETLWRGPYGKYEITPKKFNRIIMIAQGTGIAPFISIIENILNNEDNMTRIILVYCCKCDETILFRDYLYSLKSYWNFKYEIFLSNISEICKYKYQEPINKFRFDCKYLNQFKPFGSETQFLICGSSEFLDKSKFCLIKEVPVTENIVLF